MSKELIGVDLGQKHLDKKSPKQFKKYVGSESDFTKSVARYLDSIGVLYTHVANELKTNIKFSKGGKAYSPTGNKLKAMGKKSGVPDFLIFEPNSSFVGYAIELKVGSNKTSPEQKEWLKRLENNKWKTLVSYSLDEVINEIDNYLR